MLPRTLPLLALVAACAGSDAAPEPPPDLVLVDVTVVDGTGAAPLPGRTVEVRDGRITAVRPTAPGDVATIDVAGGFVTPGLIDAHVHLASEPEAIRTALDSMLSLGITSAREMACCAPQYVEALAEVDPTELTGLYWSAFWAGPTFMESDLRLREQYAEAGHAPWLLAVTDTTSLATELQRARATGASAIKIYSDMEPSLVEAVAVCGSSLKPRS